MWLMMLGGIGTIITALIRYFKEKKQENMSNIVPNTKKDALSADKKLNVSVIQSDQALPNIG